MTSYYTGTSTSSEVARHSHYEIDELESSVAKLRGELEQLRGEHYTTTESVSDVESAVERVRDSVEDLESQLEAVTERADWLEAVIVRAGLVKSVKLEGSAADRKLGQARVLGLQAESSLLSEHARETKQATINEVRRARRIAAEARAEVAAAAARVGAIDTHDHPETDGVAGAYLEAKRKLDKAVSIINNRKDAAATYETELADDDRMRAELAETIAVGRRAWMTLVERYKTVIGEAVASGAMFPRWFVAGFGPSAPADGVERWIATAAAVVAYRITYGVTSEEFTLGGEPAYNTRRYLLYQDLLAQIRH